MKNALEENHLNKVLLWVCWATALFLSAYLATQLHCKHFIPWFLFFFGVLCFCVYHLFLKTPSRKELLWSILFSLAFGEAVSIGNTVRYFEMRSGMNQNTLSLSKETLLTGVLLSFLLFPAVIILSRKVNKLSFSERTNGRKVFFQIAWGLIFLGWIPWLIAWYPGGIVGDGATVIEEALKDTVPSSNHFVVCYILFIRVFVNLGIAILPNFVDGIQLGIFFYAIVSCILISCTLAGVISFLYHRGMPSWMAWIFVGLFALTGFFVSHASCLWKDAIFSAGVVWLTLLIWKISENGKPNHKQLIYFLLITLFLCFWRNNGVWLLLLLAVGLVVFMGIKNSKTLLIVILVVSLLFFAITGPVYSAIGIKNDGLIQSIAVPLQQIAACVNSNVPMNESQKEIVFQILSPEDWAKYAPTLNDDLKNSLNQDVLKNKLGGLITVWLQLMIPNLKTYIRAYLMLMLGFWQPFLSWQGNYYDYWLGIQDLYGRGYHRINLLSKLGSKTLNSMVNANNVWFISSGTIVWLMILSTTLILMQPKHRKKKLIPLLPMFASWVVIMIASPIAYAYRYILMIPMMLPMLVFLPFYQPTRKPSL